MQSILAAPRVRLRFIVGLNLSGWALVLWATPQLAHGLAAV